MIASPFFYWRSTVTTIGAHGGAQLFLFRLTTLLIEHAHFRAMGSFSLLAPNLGNFLFFRTCRAAKFGFDLIEQEAACQKTIETLGSFLLALDANPGRAVMEHHAGRDLVDVLAAGAGRADELLVDILLAHADREQALG